jgi:type IV pilus assembly protein PilN
VRNLEKSDRFVSPRLGGETALTPEKATAFGRAPAPGPGGMRNVNDQQGNGVEFEIFSGYNPLPPDAGKKEVKRDAIKTAKPKTPGPKPSVKAKPKTGKAAAAKVPPARGVR